MADTFRRGWIIIPLLATLAACRDSSVAAYRIPKERDQPATQSAAAGQPAAMPGSGSDLAVARGDAGTLTWTAPADWKPKAGSAMRKGSYSVGVEGGALADLSITAFPGDVGGEVANVNRWRGQIGLADLPEAEVSAAITRLMVGGLPVGYVDLVNGDQQMLAAFVPHQGATWFFKLTGPKAIVSTQKQAYVDFLRSIKAPPSNAVDRSAAAAAAPAAPATSPADMANTAVVKADGPDLKWSAPAHWESRPPSAMRKGSYTVKGADGVAGDISITAFPGDVGGELANVNRWRNQLQLVPLAAEQLEGSVTRRNEGSLRITIVDLSGGGTPPVRMLGAIVPFNGATWFIKLVGPDELVAREKPAFLEFLHTLQTP